MNRPVRRSVQQRYAGDRRTGLAMVQCVPRLAERSASLSQLTYYPIATGPS